MSEANTLDQQRIYNTYRYYSKIAAGLCVDCGSMPAVASRRRCTGCLVKAASKALNAGRKRKNEGLCLKCGEPATAGIHCARCRDLTLVYNSRYRHTVRSVVLDHYGHSCVCCGETMPMLLTVDHIDGNGKKHRDEVAGSFLHAWLAREFRRTGQWPSGFQILCYNCNCGRFRDGGKCPHKERVECEKTG